VLNLKKSVEISLVDIVW